MGDSGLKNSIWAHAGGSYGASNQRPGDWNCQSCGFSNYKWRKSCLRCPPTTSTSAANTEQVTAQPGLPQRQINAVTQSAGPFDTQSHVLTFESRAKVAADASSELGGQHGLSVSIWAPRTPGKKQPLMNAGKVWTRTTSAQHGPTPSRPVDPISNASDMGLPYQVQHCILVMIERMLEESCYEFASRWVPDLLHAKRWDCAEAVELSTWRTFLPTSLPPNAIRPMSNYTLEAALGDAVRIRNSAVHRHLCDNEEIRRMALQAQDLMSMFSDSTRQHKFYRLWIELKEWDTANILDTQAARSNLEAALQEISERPIDDMDWTPNAMSLQEVTLGSDISKDHLEYSTDAMELD